MNIIAVVTSISYLVGIKFLLDKLSQLDIALPVTEEKRLGILNVYKYIFNSNINMCST